MINAATTDAAATRRSVWLIVAGFVVFRLVNLATYGAIASARGGPWSDLLFSWDSQWLIRAAKSGWVVPGGGLDEVSASQSTWAWPPLVPLLGRTVGSLPGADASWALVGLNLFGGLVASLLIFVLVREMWGNRAARIAALAWSALPASPVFLLAYAEGIFLAFCFGALLAMQRSRFNLAGVLLVPAGLSKLQVVPFALALIVVVVAARWKDRERGPSWMTVVISSSLATLAVAAWPAYVAVRFSAVNAYSRVQSAWNWEQVPLVGTSKWLVSVVAMPNRAAAFALAALVVSVVAAIVIARNRTVSPAVKSVGILGPIVLILLGAGASTVRYVLSFPAIPMLLAVVASTRRRVVLLFVILSVGQFLWIFVFVAAGPTEWPP